MAKAVIEQHQVIAGLLPLLVPIGEVKPLEGNPRLGDVRAIARSLETYGQRKPIVVNTATGQTEAGNHTLEAALELGWTHIAAVYVMDDPATAAGFALADNRTAELGGYDDQALADMISDVRQADAKLLSSTGWDPGAIAEILSRVDAREEGKTAVDYLPQLEDHEPAVSKPGDIWICEDPEHGPRHAVVCGDARDTTLVARALAALEEDEIHCIWTDPPYGIDYVASREHRPGAVAVTVNVAGDDLDNEDLENLLAEVLGTATEYMPLGAPFYMTAHKPLVFARAAVRAGLDPRHELVWVKGIFTMGRADYQYSHEKVVAGEVPPPEALDALGIHYGWIPGGAHPWYGGRTQTSVFQVPKPVSNPLHPTQKPVELIEMMIIHSTLPDAVIYDPFAGSGSTLIAAARLTRKSIMVEQDPGYVDTIVERWREWSGGEAALA